MPAIRPLLGRHVRQRSFAGGDALAVRGGEAEVSDPHATVVRHEDVLGLHVAMNETRLVGGAKTARDVDEGVDDLRQRVRSRASQWRRKAAHEPHHDVDLAVGASDVVIVTTLGCASLAIASASRRRRLRARRDRTVAAP
ncbi:MAG: hypothetical protein U0235_25505 [Polyangiaceae bacterium]